MQGQSQKSISSIELSGRQKFIVLQQLTTFNRHIKETKSWCASNEEVFQPLLEPIGMQKNCCFNKPTTLQRKLNPGLPTMEQVFQPLHLKSLFMATV